MNIPEPKNPLPNQNYDSPRVYQGWLNELEVMSRRLHTPVYHIPEKVLQAYFRGGYWAVETIMMATNAPYVATRGDECDEDQEDDQ
jgi:hypothetical protein